MDASTECFATHCVAGGLSLVGPSLANPCVLLRIRRLRNVISLLRQRLVMSTRVSARYPRQCAPWLSAGKSHVSVSDGRNGDCTVRNSASGRPTVAYGHRVYTLSVPTFLSLLVFVSAVSLSTGWLVQTVTAPGVLSALSPWLTQTGISPVVETALHLTATELRYTRRKVREIGSCWRVRPHRPVLAGPSSEFARRFRTRSAVRTSVPDYGSGQDGGKRHRASNCRATVNADSDSREQTGDRADTADTGSDEESPEHSATQMYPLIVRRSADARSRMTVTIVSTRRGHYKPSADDVADTDGDAGPDARIRLFSNRRSVDG